MSAARRNGRRTIFCWCKSACAKAPAAQEKPVRTLSAQKNAGRFAPGNTCIFRALRADAPRKRPHTAQKRSVFLYAVSCCDKCAGKYTVFSVTFAVVPRKGDVDRNSDAVKGFTLLGVVPRKGDVGKNPRVGLRRVVRGVQDVLAMEQPPQLPHLVDFAFAVSARNRQPELAVHPQPVIIDSHHVVQQHLLPIHGGAAALLVQLDGLAAFGLIIRQYKRLCGGLASEPGRFPGHAQRHPLSTSYQAHVGHLPENGHEKSTVRLHRAFCLSYSGIISKSLFPSSEYCR